MTISLKQLEMNKSRREKLNAIIMLLMCLDKMNGNEILPKLKEAAAKLEDVYEDEQIALDSMPDNLQYSARADMFNDNIDNLNDAMIDLGLVIDEYAKSGRFDNVQEEISSVINNCTEAIERR